MDKLCKTKKGQITKQKIIDVSKKLLYEQGFLNTTIAQITKESGVNNGLFTYYFGTKGKLASMISTEYRLNLRNAVSKRMYEDFKEYNMALGLAVEVRMNVKMQYYYPKLLRFSVETYSENHSPIDINFLSSSASFKDAKMDVKRDHYYKLQKRLINPEISDLDLKFYQIAGIAISHSIMTAFHRKEIECSIEYLGDKIIRSLFFLLEVNDHEYINYLIERSNEMASKIDFNLKPYFELEFKGGR